MEEEEEEKTSLFPLFSKQTKTNSVKKHIKGFVSGQLLKYFLVEVLISRKTTKNMESPENQQLVFMYHTYQKLRKTTPKLENHRKYIVIIYEKRVLMLPLPSAADDPAGALSGVNLERGQV